MFKNLLSFWQGKDFLSDVLGEFETMMINAEKMFKAVRRRLIDGETEVDAQEKIYQVDQNINALEKDIRKRIVEHLALQPLVDVTVCLVLMSVVKDAERLGDYAKNLYEVTNLLEEPLDKKLFRSFFNESDERLVTLAEKTRSAFLQSDELLARELFVLERDISFKCEGAIERLAQGELSSNISVCFTLIARYFKRIASHLLNIGTSVVMPLDQLDFRDVKEEKKTNQ